MISENARKVLEARYLAKDENGKCIETVEQMFRRVAKAVASASYKWSEDVEKIEQDFYDMMYNLDFLPNSPTLMNAGRPLGQLSACFVLPVEDSMEGIFDAIKNAALIHKSGGGTGFSFSRLRPKNSTVASTGGVASGAVSFMKVFDAATEAVKQGGCFVGDTYVATSEGAVKIKDLKEGTLVYSFDPSSGIKLRQCSKPWMTRKHAEVWKLTTNTGFEVVATPDHPIMKHDAETLEKSSYKKLSEFASGDMLKYPSFMDEIKVESVSEFGNDDVWNVEVEDTHNYVVCNEDMTVGFVVSNTRRGANMGILRIDHPDILEFIDCKNDTHQINNFNISVGITDKFMKALENGEDYNIVNPQTKTVVGKLNAKEVFDKIVDSAWRTGEPGIIFLDRLNRDNCMIDEEEIEATNPCGEQPLLPYEACNLGSINLVNHVVWDKEHRCYKIHWSKLTDTVRKAVTFLDNVIEVNHYPLPKIAEKTLQTRKIGLGVMGFADMLLLLGVPYNSEEAISIAEEVIGHIKAVAYDQTDTLGELRGSFPAIDRSTLKSERPMRNATVTTIAPTGTLSIIAGVSSGIEPVFAYAYIRNIMDGTHLIETNAILEKKLEAIGKNTDEIKKKIADNGTLANIEELPKYLREVFVCSHDVSPEWHIKMQAAFQKFTDNAVSKTVNFPNNATREDVAKVYMDAYRLGCKGTTIYRDGSRDSQVLNIKKVNDGKGESKTEPKIEYGKIVPRPRPDVTTGYTEKVKIGCGNLYITVNYDEKGICEVFTNTGRAGGCASQSEATARLVSVAIRSGVDAKEIVQQLKGIRCPSCLRQKGVPVTSCPDAIAKSLERVLKTMEECRLEPVHPSENIKQEDCKNEKNAKYCPECGSELEHEGGCVTCRNCGYSKCS